METTSFSARRQAAGALPPFSLPPPNSEIPSMHLLLSHRPKSPFFESMPSGSLTASLGVSDGLSPSMSSVNTTSSQSSQAHGNLGYTYSSAQVHGGWHTHNGASYTVGPTSPDQHYSSRPPMYGQPSLGGFGNARSSQSPATGGEGLSNPSYTHVHQSFQTPISGGGSGPDGGHHLSAQASQHAGMLNSTQSHPSANASAPVDHYSQARSHSNSNYYSASSTPQQANFSSYTAHQQSSPTGSSPGPRGLHHHSNMAPPTGSYRFGSFSQPMSSLNGPGSVMSNMQQSSSHLALVPAMSLPASYGSHPHSMMVGYPHQAQPQSERPFKCDQCTASFSRNHDLKRHKRIHLAVKPFPCSFCSKSFSRKDALKVCRSSRPTT